MKSSGRKGRRNKNATDLSVFCLLPFLISFTTYFLCRLLVGSLHKGQGEKVTETFFFSRSTALVDEKLETQNCGQRTTRVFDDSLVWC